MAQKMSNADKIRNYFREHPGATIPEVQLALPECNTVKSYVSKDMKAGLCRRKEDGTIDYSIQEKRQETEEWKKEVIHELIDGLVDAFQAEANITKKIQAAETIRLMLKEV
ncbi:hypothetical protein VNN36_06185 [Lactococcus garvieae]|uniref:hypothetical protein n=1 Tax=Lactococcus garvieae TaxID=1363 RepID=UPI0030D36A92